MSITETLQEQTVDPAALAARQQQVNLRAAAQRLDLLEDYLAQWGQVVDFSDISSFGDEPNGGRGGLPTFAPEPQRGNAYPQTISLVYINEAQLRQIRSESRALSLINPFCIGAQRNRIAYTVGKGHTYKCSLVDKDAMSPDDGLDLLSKCRNEIDDFCKLNRWSARQKETVRRMDRDGEAFRRFFIDETKGQLHVRFIEPLCVQDVGLPGTWFGIEFVKYDNGYDMETPAAFYVRDIGALGESVGQPVRVDAAEIQHLKANVDMDSPRGLPTWYALRSHFDRAMRLLRNIATVAEVQAAIAGVRKHVGAARNIVEQAISKDATVRKSGPEGDMQNVKRIRPGSFIDIPETVDWQFPQQGIDVTRYVAGVQAELRAIGAALAMPEYMITGDASNANFASTMVAEGPAVKTFEEMQADLIEADLVVIRIALSVAADAGRLPDNVLDLVEVEAEPPIIKSENRLAEAQADQILVQNKVMSKDTMAARHGLEYEAEHDKIATEDAGGGAAGGPAGATSSGGA